MTEDPLADGAASQQGVNQDRLAQALSTLAAAIRQPTASLDPDQQILALRYKLLLNGLGKSNVAFTPVDQALIRIDQIQHQGWYELVIRDPLPPGARTMVVVVDSTRVPQNLPGYSSNGVRVCRVEGEWVTSFVELVEFLDQFGVPVAAGVPVLQPGHPEDEYQETEMAMSELGNTSRTQRDGSTPRRTQRRQGS